jgi:hypothetical protein
MNRQHLGSVCHILSLPIKLDHKTEISLERGFAKPTVSLRGAKFWRPSLIGTPHALLRYISIQLNFAQILTSQFSILTLWSPILYFVVGWMHLTTLVYQRLNSAAVLHSAAAAKGL